MAEAGETGKAPGVTPPEPVEVGEHGVERAVKSPPSGHKHRYQTFRNLGEASDPKASKFHERCAGCGHVKGARD